MTGRSASLHSIEAVRRLKAALQEFADEVADTLILLELESRRPLEWVENDRSKYWPREFRKASDWVAEARIALERCELTSSGDERRSCYDERKMLEKAKRRLRLCEEKIPIVQRWRAKLRKEIEEFKVQLARMNNFLETDVPRAVASLERMAAALDSYVNTTGAPRTLAPAGGMRLEADGVARSAAGTDAPAPPESVAEGTAAGGVESTARTAESPAEASDAAPGVSSYILDAAAPRGEDPK